MTDFVDHIASKTARRCSVMDFPTLPKAAVARSSRRCQSVSVLAGDTLCLLHNASSISSDARKPRKNIAVISGVS